MLKLNQRGIAHLFVLILLVVGIVGGLYLIKNPQILKSRAGGGPIWFTSIGGGTLPLNSSNIP